MSSPYGLDECSKPRPEVFGKSKEHSTRDIHQTRRRCFVLLLSSCTLRFIHFALSRFFFYHSSIWAQNPYEWTELTVKSGLDTPFQPLR